ncbi:GldG family protein [Clostridium swellfunianum]|uniref:Gldg family protein n=1 Tax=Clostridium swellfunianum TaxID=1367462 RepID=UPI0020305AE2|nr:GldG family protein [Clostridium swellfunianum]
MKKLNIKKSFKTSNFKYGGYSTLLTILVLAVLVAVNLVAGKLNIKKDLTQDKLYTLSEETSKILNNLQKDTKIMLFFETGKKDPNISAVMDKYKAASKKLIFEEHDPFKQPQLAQKYSKDGKNVGIGTIVVEQGNRFKTISYDDFFGYTVGSYGEENVDSFAAEQQLTNAIVYVNSDKEQILYTLSGHDESALSGDVISQLQVENYSVQDINLLQGNAVLNKGDMLIVNSPKRDISKDEAEKIKSFLKNGGRAAFFVDINKEVLPNLQELLSFYAIKLQNAVAVEGEANRVARSQLELLPELQSHEIINDIKSKNMLIFTPVAQGVEELKDKRETVKIESLLKTSDNSWAKTNLNTTTLTKEGKDLTGPFNIAVAITDEDNTTKAIAKLIVVGSSTFMNSNINQATNGANLDFIMNSFNWLQDKKDGTTLRPKTLTSESLTMTNLQKLSFSAMVVIILPAAILAAGVIVWLRRRHR